VDLDGKGPAHLALDALVLEINLHHRLHIATPLEIQHAGVEHQEDVALDRDHRGADAHLLE